ncbi:MAG: chemotaxis protein CheD [SAR324 cluster bacterium]|nr:chemotaxis protein CheD [SAR324 cluster bacterium]
MGQTIYVPIAGMGIGKSGDKLYTVVGSCVAIMLYDKHLSIGGMIHIMLGYSRNRKDNPTKYADTGIPYLIRMMCMQGASPHRLKSAKISGAGEMFEVLNQDTSVSRSNIKDVKELLEQHDIQIIASDLGGTSGRRVSFDTSTGRVQIVAQGRRDMIL